MFKTFKQYLEEVSHAMNHEEALKFVISQLGIIDNPDPNDENQMDQINDALSSPLSSYPEKLDDLANQPQIKDSSNYPQIQALLGNPEKATVSKLIATLSSKNEED